MNNAALPAPNCRILLVDDDPSIHQLVTDALTSHEIRVVSALNGDEALESAQHEPPDALVLDCELPGTTGLDVLDRLRTAGIPVSTPALFVTESDAEETLSACFQAGAADYLRKPLYAPEVCARVRSVLDRKQLVTQLERLALQDPLTGLPNRLSIRERIQKAIDKANGDHCALLFLDFDRFKLVNDSLGHDVGDQLLQQIANRLRAALRRDDGVAHNSDGTLAARLGGDEFVVFLQDLSSPQDAPRVADRLLRALADTYQLAGHEVCCTASIGVVTSLEKYATPDEVLRDADTAMYEAKAAGKGRYVVFDQTMHANAEARLQIENDLHGAIANSELVLAFQPIVSLETGRTVGCEAFVRWNHPGRGVILPAEFVPIAEESGTIVPIEMWALEHACQAFSQWQRTMGIAAPSWLHVNLSGKQLLLRDLSENVRAILERNAVPAGCLHLEVREGDVMRNPQVARAAFRELQEVGVRISLDHFGTGLSSLSCLHDLPIDALKIDRSFIANMEQNRSFAALVHAVTTLGQNLGLTAIATGIETEDQLAMLQTMNCDYGQGNLFGAPIPVQDFTTQLGPVTRPRDFDGGQRAPVEMKGALSAIECVFTQEGK